jgi:hypothetical protein
MPCRNKAGRRAVIKSSPHRWQPDYRPVRQTLRVCMFMHRRALHKRAHLPR